MQTDLTHILHDPSELALAEACAAGDRQAQRMLWLRYKNRMFGVCVRFAPSKQAAEDVLQDAFVEIFRSIGKFRGEGSLEGWMRRITVRMALQHLKKQQLRDETLDIEQLEKALYPDEEHTDFNADENDEPGRLTAMLQQLPPGFRAVLNLYVIEERSHEEISRELGISVGTSKSQLNRAKAFLRRLLDKTPLLLW